MQKINAISFGDSVLPVSVNTDSGMASDQNFQSVIGNVKSASPAVNTQADTTAQSQASPAAKVSKAVKGKEAVAQKDTDYVNVSGTVASSDKMAGTPGGTAVNVSMAGKELAAAEKAVAEAVQDVLGMNDEEFAAALTEMGITVFDLLNPAVLQEFVMTLNPGSDVMDFLTDENMLQSFTDIAQSIETVDWESLTGMSKEEFQAYLEDTVSSAETGVLPDEAKVLDATRELRMAGEQLGAGDDFVISSDVQTESLPDETAAQPAEFAADMAAYPEDVQSEQVTVFTEDAVVPEKTSDILPEDQAAGVQEVSDEIPDQERDTEELPVELIREMPEQSEKFSGAEEAVQNAGGAVSHPLRETDGFRQASESNVQASVSENIQMVTDVVSGQTDSSGQQTLSWSSQEQVLPGEEQVHPENVTTVMDFIDNMMQAVSGDNTLEQPVDMQQMIDIVNQVVERIHSTMEEGTTRLEMQLNPESLGRLLLTVTNKNGVMTAHFTVQTAEAKAAIESQMITLRENLEQKNLKVEAVEVEVSDFTFSQSGQADTGDQKEFSRGDGRRSRFQFEDDEEQETEEAVVSDAERVRRQVMQDNGSSIDFTA